MAALDRLFGPPTALPTIAQLSHALGVAPDESVVFRPFARAFEFADVVALTATDGTRRGLVVNCPLTDPRSAERIVRAARLILPHLSAGLRLRRAARYAQPEAILGTDGRWSEGDVPQSAREALRRGVIARERARTSGASDEIEALTAWTALVDGRWSLVDAFERGGKRFVVAHPNLPEVHDPRGLGPIESVVLAHLARGDANKAIAFALGLDVGTVSGYVSAIRRKLGSDGIRFSTTLERARTVPVQFGAAELVALIADPPDSEVLSALTAAERAVVHEVITGATNEQIAARRRVRARTIANQLASAYRKLGVGSRRELHARLGRA
jgi:DNA-binding NarL/FixJ family response regulator